MDLSSAKIYVAGHTGLVGSAIVRRLQKDGATNLLLKSSTDLDLRKNQSAVESFFAAEQPEIVFLAAAKVGGIHANNSFPAEFLHDNLTIQTQRHPSHPIRKTAQKNSASSAPRASTPKHAPPSR